MDAAFEQHAPSRAVADGRQDGGRGADDDGTGGGGDHDGHGGVERRVEALAEKQRQQRGHSGRQQDDP